MSEIHSKEDLQYIEEDPYPLGCKCHGKLSEDLSKC